jgi:hypothetical protein
MHYTDELKITVVNLVICIQITQSQARKQSGIKGHSSALKWI